MSYFLYVSGVYGCPHLSCLSKHLPWIFQYIVCLYIKSFTDDRHIQDLDIGPPLCYFNLYMWAVYPTVHTSQLVDKKVKLPKTCEKCMF